MQMFCQDKADKANKPATEKYEDYQKMNSAPLYQQSDSSDNNNRMGFENISNDLYVLGIQSNDKNKERVIQFFSSQQIQIC